MRIMHRVYEGLTSTENLRPQGAREVKKDPKLKTVTVDGQVMGYPRGKTWMWTPAARKMYNSDVLEYTAAFAEQI